MLNWSGYVHARLATSVERTLTLRASQGRVPDNLKKYVGVKGKNLPTIRSVSMSRPGWCMVEADLQTAEMRGLAFISGDTKFLDMLMGVDHDFAFIADEFVPDGVDPMDCVVRTSFPDYIEQPADKDKFLYAMAAGGEVKYTFNANQLKVIDGRIARPKQDLHWNIAERAQRKAREAMDKKKDRGAGKVVNFCVAKGTGIVFRKNGKISVRNIEDLVHEGIFEAWDGSEWVSTQVLERGFQKVVRHPSGLVATPDHIVWTESGPMTLLEAVVRLETLTGQDAMGGYAWGHEPPVIEAEDVPLDVYERRALVRDIMLFGYNGTSSHRRDTYDKYGIGLPSCPVQNLAQAAGLLALILPSTLCYDLVDCGPHHRFATVYGLVHNSSSYGGQASSLQRKIEADTGHQVPLEMVEAMLQAIVDRAPRADEFFHEMEEKPFKAGFIRAASGRLRHCTAFGSEGEKLSKRTRDGAVSALGRECRNFP